MTDVVGPAVNALTGLVLLAPATDSASVHLNASAKNVGATSAVACVGNATAAMSAKTGCARSTPATTRIAVQMGAAGPAVSALAPKTSASKAHVSASQLASKQSVDRMDAATSAASARRDTGVT